MFKNGSKSKREKKKSKREHKVQFFPFLNLKIIQLLSRNYLKANQSVKQI